ncbi:MAG: P-II family nitrogen regulator [Bacilli bacterium]|jgi:nitrogen regulatory protein PII|nr:P-II family nitrogen regulator [Bacilli bacterium]
MTNLRKIKDVLPPNNLFAPEKESESSFTPYEKSHKLEPLYFFMAIVPDGQADAVVKEVISAQGAVGFLTHGKGTASRDFYEVFGIGEDRKQIVISLIKQATWFPVKANLKARFAISDFTKGIAFIVKLDAICGVSVYKMLTDNRGIETSKLKEEKKMEPQIKRNDYELVMCIVNEGLTDLVMDAAKKAGARGGTILSARGTGNKEIEQFFGVIITPEKQIVLILVPKEIKDKVMAAVNREVGIDTKGQGIAFALLVDDVAGLAGEEEEPESEKKE